MNKDWVYVLRRTSITVLAIVAVVAGIVSFGSLIGNAIDIRFDNRDRMSYDADYQSDLVLDEINSIRKEVTLPCLRRVKSLDESATKKACDMANRDYWSHTAPNGATGWDFMKDSGYNYTHAGEILARNCEDLRCVVLWVDSFSHYTQIVGDKFNDFGVGRCGNITVVHFGAIDDTWGWPSAESEITKQIKGGE